MSRQPIAGTGAAGRSPSGAAATRPPAPSPSPSPQPSSPLPPQRYRALRARYNALLVTLYERTSLTLREIAGLAGRTDRAVQTRVRALGCRPRNARTCRPGTDVGLRRAGSRLSPLNAKATRRAVAAFAGVARELAASAQMRAGCELQRATARAERRTARTQTRVMASATRELAHLAAAIEGAAAAQHALAGGRKRKAKSLRANKHSRAPAKAPQPRSRPDLRRAQERVLREQQARMWQAHQAAARRAEAAPTAAPPLGPDGTRRIDGVAERAPGTICAESRKQPRIRRLW